MRKERQKTGFFYRFMKRAIDISGGLFLFAVASPLFLFIPIIIKLDSHGPSFFLQKRCGKDGREFKMFKFRTMVNDAESIKVNLKNVVDGPMFKHIEDPRVTRVGRILRRWSLDELPQLFNVFSGEISLVGPRPLAREEMNGNDVWKKMRLSVKPGMTGLWQIKARQSHQYRDWIKYDLEYVDNRSFNLDFKILLSTVEAVIRRKYDD